jgi:hypothetical protein
MNNRIFQSQKTALLSEAVASVPHPRNQLRSRVAIQNSSAGIDHFGPENLYAGWQPLTQLPSAHSES